ncbi:NAD(P)/FAD-dependent oxidoreductase [Pseudochelatococcus lubricantis]|uniref:NAD(P)/FAD-dependent oxidoreductase n=1 Tax=Pseudochelatococcus lubricantis TaxID=1538102 RepID=UPI0035EA9913
MEHVDCVVIGAGVVGLAVARAMAAAGRETVVLERNDAFGTETSSRNSEVIHAGLYYTPGSLKARLCVRGRDMLYAFAASHGVAHSRCGKLIVATDLAQQPVLDEILHRAAACGVNDLHRLSAEETHEIEPEVHCVSALMSPSTGIVDSHGYMLALLGEAEARGAMLSLNTEATAIRATPAGFEVDTVNTATGDGFTLATRLLINAAGCAAPRVAGRIAGLSSAHVPKAYFARGTYYALPGRPVFSHLVYPVPEPGGLGVHLTLDLGGGMRFGPDVEWIEEVDYSVDGGRKAHFEREIRKYWPALPADALEATFSGVRPKISGPGEPAADFRIDGAATHGLPGLVNLFGIESPGLTASLAIAEYVAAELAE